MTRRLDDDLKTLGAVHRAFAKVPKHVRLRTLAYFVSRELDVPQCEASELLYCRASEERAKESQLPGEGPDK